MVVVVAAAFLLLFSFVLVIFKFYFFCPHTQTHTALLLDWLFSRRIKTSLACFCASPKVSVFVVMS